MIRYPRGALEGSPVVGEWVSLAVGSGSLLVEVPVDIGPAGAGDLAIAATTTVHVGIEDHDVAILLGRWTQDAADPGGPLGLGGRPVVVVPDAALVSIAVAGLHRAGRSPSHRAPSPDVPGLGLAMLVAAAGGVEAIVIGGGAAPALRLARILGGRPVAALPLPHMGAAATLLATAVDVTVAVPAPDEETREAVRALLAPLGLESVHQLVDVDPTPAFAELGRTVAEAPLAALAAGAAGVLAGRLARTGGRWREELGG